MPRSVVIAHGDGDGVCSAALVKAAVGADLVYFSHPAGLVGDLRHVVKEGDLKRVYIVDIALSEPHLGELAEIFSKLLSRGVRVVYIDHHPLPLDFHELPVKMYHREGKSASELTYNFFSRRLSPEYSRVALYGAISDYVDKTEWVGERLREWDKRDVYFEAGVLSLGLEGLRRDHDYKRGVVEMLSLNLLPSSDERLVRLALESEKTNEAMRIWVKDHVTRVGKIGYVMNPEGSLGRAAVYAAVYSGAAVGLAAEERDHLVNMSLRSRAPGVDLNKILRTIAPRFGGTGGGHPHAAGARVPKERFHSFLRVLGGVVG